MGKKGIYVGIAIVIVVIIIIFLYTNIFELIKPTVDQSVESAKDVISQVNGTDVVSEAEKVTSSIVNETSKIEIKDPFP